MNKPQRLILNLKGGDEVRLGGLTLLTVHEVGQPMLKATISAQILKGDEHCIFDHNEDNWKDLESLDSVVVGLGDRLLIGTVEILVASISKRYGEVRLSFQSYDEETAKLLKNLKESLR
ncbi:ATP-dependent DNA helicase [Vibrio phage SHOU24]|uniref:ATP-dependent DNA helicase n=1 Tax=Vibrio phage SHOU24 TaxID=1414739 RepID=UPI0003ED211F|nr:ATP-dependent DNA helicase [Vibrio phage SHOU24]AHI61227.1 ATP-dependent DNA helicase [Vibrio phage SHOU24]